MAAVQPESIRKASELKGFLKMEDVFVQQTRRKRTAHEMPGMIQHGMFSKLQITWQELKL